MKLEIVQTGEPVLRSKARSLSKDELASPWAATLIANMKDTMRAAPGVGLAAPQIGEGVALVVIEDRPEYMENVAPEQLAEKGREPVPFHVLCNPVLTVVDPTPAEFFEGCLSFAGFVGLVPRASAVRVEAWNERAEPVVIEARGWYARILQHEIDHLLGNLCIDRMHTRSLMTAENYTRHWGGQTVLQIRRALTLG